MTAVPIQNKMAGYSRWVSRMGADSRMLATHVSLFAAIFVCWQRSGFESPFPVSRKMLMSYSRISSFATYHKCIRQLDEYGYIRYRPSFDPVGPGSLVWLPEIST
ncbi:hypothetical protein [uncultured Mucilaginibacter sp.]|uniref:hypothetical protein n=1 Tax=uncultured Mucilaginibacter sp. TaxID=797541 RepID=UPI00261316DA|nr:hypothetical protein [uncultured Mucilaginibacter sp.]